MANLYYDKILRDDLNYAFSINYMVLENLDKLMPKNGQMIFSRNDIFGQKSREEEIYNLRFHEFAKVRNECFSNIQKGLDSFNCKEKFKANSECLLGVYNQSTGNNIKYDDLFGNDDVKNWELFQKINQSVNTEDFDSLENRGRLVIALHQFSVFYEDYKLWKIVSEIFDVLQNDINGYGSKTLYFGKPDNQNIIKLSKSKFDKLCSSINEILIDQEKKMLSEEKEISKRLITSEDKADVDAAGTILEKIGALMFLKKSLNDFNVRFQWANQRPYKEKNNLKNLARKLHLVKPEEKFTVDNVYIHKIELRDLIEPMAFFPEFDKYRNVFSEIVFDNNKGSNNVFDNNKNTDDKVFGNF